MTPGTGWQEGVLFGVEVDEAEAAGAGDSDVDWSWGEGIAPVVGGEHRLIHGVVEAAQLHDAPWLDSAGVWTRIYVLLRPLWSVIIRSARIFW